METLQYIQDSDTVLTLVTKKLTRSKMHELLDKLQEFISNLQEKDLSDDVIKEMTIKKNFQNAGSQVYLNYGLQAPKSIQRCQGLQSLTTKRFYPEFTQEKDFNLFEDSSVPNKKIKPSKSPELLINPFPLPEGKEALTQSHISSHNMDSFSKYVDRGYKQYTSVQKHTIPFCSDSVEYLNIAQITNQQQIIDIDELINTSTDSQNFLNNNPNKWKGHQDVSEFAACFEEYKFPSNYQKQGPSNHRNKDWPEDRERRKTYDKFSYRKNEHSAKRNYDKAIYSKSPRRRNSSSTEKAWKRHDKPSQRSQERQQKPDDDADAPIFLIDVKENEFLCQYLRKPFQYINTVREVEEEEEPAYPDYIQVD